MDILKQAAIEFDELLNTTYYFEIARKNIKKDFVCIHFPGLLQCRRQFFRALLLRFRQHVFVDGLTRFRVVARCVAALPAAIGALSQATLAVGPFLSRDQSPPECCRHSRPCTRPSF